VRKVICWRRTGTYKRPPPTSVGDVIYWRHATSKHERWKQKSTSAPRSLMLRTTDL
jgi:hypothetical protein